MEKIICSLEDWDSVINFYRPNGSSKTWYLKELKKIKIPLMWGEWNIFTEKGEMFSENDIKNLVQPVIFRDLIEFRPIDKINDSRHIYLINVYTPAFFYDNRDIGFSCISEKYKDDIINGNCKIVLLLLFEGMSGMKQNLDFEIIEEWRIKENFPENSIYYITANLIGEERAKEKNVKYKVLPISMFESWNGNFTNYQPPVSFNPVDNKNLYLSYNRQPRLNRIFIISELIKSNLFDRGLISLNKPWINQTHFLNNPEIEKFIINNTPFHIDSKHDLNFNLACNITLDDYRKTFVSLITETLVSEGTLFLSEKIWKPIIVGHPFLVYGNRHTLKYLKSLGYKTFDKWFDESYDEEPDEFKRAKLIVNEIEKYKNLSTEELIEIRKDMYQICLHNKMLFNKLLAINWDHGKNLKLNKYLLDIWRELNPDNKTLAKRRLI